MTVIYGHVGTEMLRMRGVVSKMRLIARGAENVSILAVDVSITVKTIDGAARCLARLFFILAIIGPEIRPKHALCLFVVFFT